MRIKKYKVAVVIPVLNERESISKLIDKLIKQSMKPDEIIIVDGGSKDGTIEVVKKVSKNIRKPRIKLIVAKGLNISSSRNLGILNSSCEIIMFIDADCVPEKRWIEKMYDGLIKNKKTIVGGITIGAVKDKFTKFLSLFLTRVPSSYGNKIYSFIERIFGVKNYPGYTPKTNNFCAFKKDLLKIGMFNEKLNAAEDEEILRKFWKKGYNLKIVNAIVKWGMKKNFKQLFKSFVNYGMWDATAFGISGLLPQAKLSIIMTLVPPLFVIYALYETFRILMRTKDIYAVIYAPLIRVTLSYGYLLGIFRGIMRKLGSM